MASDGQPILISVTSLVHGSQAPTTVTIRQGGNSLPPGGNIPAQDAKAAQARAAENAGLTAQVGLLNKYLNDSGRPDQFRVAPNSDDKMIQEINPATGEVIAEYSASEFAALARSVGISGVVVNRRV